MNAVTVSHITKSYDRGRLTAVDNISLSVADGELFGLIGPDGAGKTSLFRILATLVLADSGSATVGGYDVVKDYRSVREHIGYMPGRFSLYQDLTVLENLQFFAALFGTTITANCAIIKDIYDQLKPFSDRRAGRLSGGMKQKLALCCALIHKPRILLLDEPTTGVDVVSRREFWNMLKNLKAQGITILVSTPYMDEAVLCERIALAQNGRIMSVDSPAGIIAAYPSRLYAVRSDDIYRLLADTRAFDRVSSSYPFGEYLHISFRNEDEANPRHLSEHISGKGHTHFEIRPIEPTIEDSFIYLMTSGSPGSPLKTRTA